MSLLTYRNLSMAFGGPPVLDDVTFVLQPKERVCLIGRNGEGKSTLLKILAGQLPPDQGEREEIPGLRVGFLGQAVPDTLSGSVFDIVSAGLGPAADRLAEYHHLLDRLASAPDDDGLAQRLDTVQAEIDRTDGWTLEHRIENLIDRVELKPDTPFDALSGGDRRRALLARALVADPHILLLDEPTNHLDLLGIRWLEEFILRSELTILFVSHDRALVRRLATRILELDRGQITSYGYDYTTYLRRRGEALDAESKQQAVFDRKLAAEEVWIRKGVQARRTRNQGRVRALIDMRRERARRRQTQGQTQLQINTGQLSGNKVIDVNELTYRWEGQAIVEDFTTTIWRGDRIGVTGLNGAGKTTLLRLLLKELEPESGWVRHGTKLEVVYFDQHRQQLDPAKTIVDNVSPNRESVRINGRERHIITYLQDFLFTPDMLRMPITGLSGGERARLLLARIFVHPANVMVFDEPTNDLDVETIELLEEKLFEFPGTILVVSHDREFLNNVVTSTLALDGSGRIQEYAGGCDDWLAEVEAAQARSPIGARSAGPGSGKPKPKTQPPAMTKREREALAGLPARIEALETEQASLAQRMADPQYHRSGDGNPAADTARLEALDAEIAECYETWEALEEKARGLAEATP